MSVKQNVTAHLPQINNNNRVTVCDEKNNHIIRDGTKKTRNENNRIDSNQSLQNHTANLVMVINNGLMIPYYRAGDIINYIENSLLVLNQQNIRTNLEQHLGVDRNHRRS